MKSNNFFNNQAIIGGGAIYIANLMPNPIFIFLNVFYENFALYGPNYASRPTRISLKSKKLIKNFYLIGYPGVKLDNFSLNILDHFGQVIINNIGM